MTGAWRSPARRRPGAQQALVATDLERWFAPPYLGPKGWVGLYLDTLHWTGPRSRSW